MRRQSWKGEEGGGTRDDQEEKTNDTRFANHERRHEFVVARQHRLSVGRLTSSRDDDLGGLRVFGKENDHVDRIRQHRRAIGPAERVVGRHCLCRLPSVPPEDDLA